MRGSSYKEDRESLSVQRSIGFDVQEVPFFGTIGRPFHTSAMQVNTSRVSW